MSGKTDVKISTRSFVSSILVIFVLMILTYILTFLIPSGTFSRVEDANGNMIIDTSVPYEEVDADFPFWKWILSPFLVLGAEGNGTLIAVIIFLLVIGGVFTALNTCGLLEHLLNQILRKFGKFRYGLLAALTLGFMLMGSLIGSFEEVVPLVPIVVGVSVAFGWDVLTGLGMSILAASCGFSAGIMNPFSVGIAQELAGLPMFSGVWFRIVAFVLIYVLLLSFLWIHAKRIEQPMKEEEFSIAQNNPRLDRALLWFLLILGIAILLVMSSSVITFLQDYTMIIIAFMFLFGGIFASLFAGMSARELGKSFVKGMVGFLPAVLLILMASSIKYILSESKILDSLLNEAMKVAESLPKGVVILFIYLIVLVMNFFVASGSAKAFLLIPLIIPIAQVIGISPQLCIVAYAFGDGFSNTFYPTNPVLLISLGLVDTGYGKYARWAGVFQLLNLLLTSGILLLGYAIGY